jgi:hypothetical protein
MWERKCDTKPCVKGQWVFGGVQEGCRETFLVVDLNRSAEMLIATIKEWMTQSHHWLLGGIPWPGRCRV